MKAKVKGRRRINAKLVERNSQWKETAVERDLGTVYAFNMLVLCLV